MAQKILIVDDVRDIVHLLESYFRRAGYQTMTALSGAEALEKASAKPDIILLDVNLPDMDGFEVCRRIREGVSCPILFLTARIEDSDKVKGFAVGGDDYVVKPFSLEELGARVAAHLRREVRRSAAMSVRFDDELMINYTDRTVTVRGQELNFAKKEFDIIEFLSQNVGQVFDRERIYERVWGYDSEGDSSVVSEHIRRIRVKLSNAGAKPYIQTVWGVGYKWVR